MSPLDRVRIQRVLDSAGYPGTDILDTIARAGIQLHATYENTKVLMNNAEHDL